MLTVGTYHPAFILRQNTRLNGVMKADFQKMVRLAKGWRPSWTDTDLMYEALPTDDLVRVIDSMGGEVTYDVETDGRHPLECDLRCLGLYDGTKGVIVPFLYRSGERREVVYEEVVDRSTGTTKTRIENRALWKRCFGNDQEKRIRAALDRLWTRARPIAQNGQYDRTVLKARWKHEVPLGDDTILLHHVLRPYLPHGLGFLASLYTDIPYYKATDSGDSWAAETDAELYLYCLHADTRVKMADGTTARIQDLVRTRSTAKVLSYDERTRSVVARPITHWFAKRVQGQRWVQLTTAHGTATVTPDHFVRGAHLWVQAKDLERGGAILSDELKWTTAQRQAVMGTLLGDSVIKVSPAFRAARHRARTAYIEGGHVNAAHAAWKSRVLHLTEKLDSKRGFTRLRSRNLVQVAQLQKLFYGRQGQRRLDPRVYEEMGPRGWAHFFMDDGCVQKQPSATHREGIVIALRRYPRSECVRLQRWFAKTYGPCSLSKVNTLHLAANTAEAFACAIAPHVHPSCRYKLPRHVREADIPFVDDDLGMGDALPIELLEVEERKVPRRTRGDVFKAETRYCIEVEGTHNFFTTAGLVKNCLRDVKATWQVWQTMRDELATARPEDARVYEQDTWQELQCQRWKERGIKLDVEALDFFRFKYRAAMTKALAAMRALVKEHLSGSKSTEALEELTAFLEAAAEDRMDDNGTLESVFNPGSLRQLRAMLRHLGVPLDQLTATGEVSTAKEFLTSARKELLQKHPKGHPGIAFLDYLFGWREASKVNSTYLYPEVLADGRVHPTFNVHVVPTGRLSSTGPNCFSGDTELMTPAGWQRIDEWVKTPGTVLQWLPGNRVEWATPTAVIKKRANDWVHITNQHIDLLVTADHRCAVESRRGALKVLAALDYPEDHKQFNAASGWVDEPRGIALTDDELRFVIATQADGSWSGNAVEFSLTKPRKVKRMRALLKRLKATFTEKRRPPDSRTGSRATRFRVQSVPMFDVKLFLGAEKKFGSWVLDLSRHQRDVFMYEVMLWDGCATRMNHYASEHRSNADWVQAVFMLSGRRANTRVYRPSAGARGKKLSHQVDVSRQAFSWTTNRKLDVLRADQPAYCLSVPSSFVLVRRNGKVMVCGQCQNQPADIRGMYVPEEGYSFVYGDWDALEMRLGAFMSQDPAFVEAFKQYDAKTGPKPHIVNMGNIFGLPKTPEAADQNPGMYRAAKVFAYAVAYGAGDATVYEQVREELPDMEWSTFQICMKNYKKAYPELFKFQASLVERGTRFGFIDTMVLGRRGYFFEKPSGYSDQSPEASAMQNFPYQGTGADVVGLANRRLIEEGGPVMRDLFQLAQVHDELLFEVPDPVADGFKATFKTLAGQSPKGFEDWNLPVDVKKTKRWKPVQTRCACRELVDVEPAVRTKASITWAGKCKKCEQVTSIEVPRGAAKEAA